MNTRTKIETILGYQGRLIGMSKSRYREQYPDRKPVFNAQIGTVEEGIIWHGDLDMVSDSEKLELIAEHSQKTLYIIPESAFFNKEYSIESMKNSACGIVYPQAVIKF